MLKELKKQKENLAKVGFQYFKRAKGNTFKSETEKLWKEDVDRINKKKKNFLFQLISAILIMSVVGSYFELFLNEISGLHFDENIVIIFSVIVVVIFNSIRGFSYWRNMEKPVSFDELYQDRLKKEFSKFRLTLVFEKNDIKSFYETLDRYYGREKLNIKIYELKLQYENIGSYMLLDRIYTETIKIAEVKKDGLKDDLNNRMLAKQVNLILDEKK